MMFALALHRRSDWLHNLDRTLDSVYHQGVPRPSDIPSKSAELNDRCGISNDASSQLL